MKIKETIVVEGRDDESAVLAAVEANIICTHGFGIRKETLQIIEKAYHTTGIIIFTDPDHAGETIRERLTKLFPNAKQAFLTRGEATKDDDIGIENACPESIRRALSAAKAIEQNRENEFSMEDMVLLGLTGLPDSAKRREELGKKLGIGSANTKTFLKRLNYMGIKKDELL